MINDCADIKQITKAHIDRLAELQVAESQTLEFKSLNWARLAAKDSWRAKASDSILQAMTAFANTDGGDLVIGVSERKNTRTIDPREPRGIGEAVDPNELIDWIESVLVNKVTPRLSDYDFGVAEGFDAGAVVAVRVRRSWKPPHAVGHPPVFFTRTNTTSEKMSFDQLHDAFTSTTVPEQIRGWRDERLKMIAERRGPVQMAHGPVAVMHMVPWSSLRASSRIHPLDLDQNGPLFGAMGAMPPYERWTVDGHLASGPKGMRSAQAARLVFFDGRYESMSSRVFGSRGDDERYIDGRGFVESIVANIQQAFSAYRALRVPPPVSVFLSFVSADHSCLNTRSGETHPLDRETLVLPEVALAVTDRIDLAELAPIFHSLWNAYGARECPFFRESQGYVGGSVGG